jgi:streptomycin 6-kinase
MICGLETKETNPAAKEAVELYVKAWDLLRDGGAFNTKSSILQPVVYNGEKAMLKIALAAEERRGASLMRCWNGNGAAKIFRYDENALLMERAVGTRSLKHMVITGNEDEASRIICGVAAKLHSAKCPDRSKLVPLPVWFEALKPAADRYGGKFTKCNKAAKELLNAPVNTVVLHGDIHYENVLDSGTRGWIAIDPKALTGERGFDFANLFCNPDAETALAPGRLSRQVKLIADEAGLHPKRLLKWIIAWTGLSAAWILNDGEDAGFQIAIAKIALAELDNF